VHQQRNNIDNQQSTITPNRNAPAIFSIGTFIIKQILKWCVLFPLSLYRLYSPVTAGKGIAYNITLHKIWGKLTDELILYTKDNMKFNMHFPEDKDWVDIIYLRQSWETGTTNVLKKIIKPDDIVFDIGANFGWYTMLFSKIAKHGQCHSFEPVPWIYNKLKLNLSLNHAGKNVYLNQLALGNTNQIVHLHTFPGENYGLSSILPLGRKEFSISDAQMITLTEYIESKKIKRVDFIKCDVEGAEFHVLKGSNGLFALKEPPIWLFETNEETAKAFNHRPSDLFAFLRNFYEYKFYRIDGAWGKLLPMSTIYDYKHGDNVLCIVPQFHEERLREVVLTTDTPSKF